MAFSVAAPWIEPAPSRASGARLGELVRGEHARVVRLEMPSTEARWLRAVGIFEGQSVRVLRRGVFGGPLHVRLGCGGEVALSASLAQHVTVEAVARPAAG